MTDAAISRRQLPSLSLPRWARAALLLSLLLLVTALIYLQSGAMALTPGGIVDALWRAIQGAPLSLSQQVVVELRLPRLLFAMLVGAALACTGVASQGLFRNPLADPAMIGVAAGAALGAALMIVVGGAASVAGVAAGAFSGGLAATLLVWLIGYRGGAIATLLLAGIAINAIVFAAIGLLQYLADDQQLRDLTFWSLGSLSAASWPRLAWVAPCILLAIALLCTQGRALNALLLGEQEARLLGFAVSRTQHLVLLLVALGVSTAVAFTGVISFVGLVVPHLLRLLLGPDNRVLMPLAALGGGLLVVLGDLLAKTLALPAELPLGVLISLLGGPFFLWLLLRSRLIEG